MKKEYILRSVTSNGDIVDENKMTLEEGTVLIQSIPSDVSIKTASHMHKYLACALENNSKLITIPHGVTLQILEVK